MKKSQLHYGKIIQEEQMREIEGVESLFFLFISQDILTCLYYNDFVLTNVINIFGVTIQAQMRVSLGRPEIKQKKSIRVVKSK